MAIAANRIVLFAVADRFPLGVARRDAIAATNATAIDGVRLVGRL